MTQNSETKEKEETGKIKWLTEGLTLAAIPVFAHIVAFIYEVGYCNVFGLPIELIQVDIHRVLIVLGAIGSIALILFNAAHFAYMTFSGGPPWLRISIARLVPTFLILAFAALAFGFSHWKEWMILIILFITQLFFEFVFPLITQRKTKGYVNKLGAQDDMEIANDMKTIPKELVKKEGGRSMLQVLLVLICSFIVSHMAGRAEALRQTDFFVVESSDWTALRFYGDRIICVRVDPKQKSFGKEIRILQMDEGDKPRVFVKRELGELHTQEEK